MAENVTHLPPPWADGEPPTSKLWTMWHAAYGHGGTDEMKRYFAEAQKLREVASG